MPLNWLEAKCGGHGWIEWLDGYVWTTDGNDGQVEQNCPSPHYWHQPSPSSTNGQQHHSASMLKCAITNFADSDLNKNNPKFDTFTLSIPHDQSPAPSQIEFGVREIMLVISCRRLFSSFHRFCWASLVSCNRTKEEGILLLAWHNSILPFRELKWIDASLSLLSWSLIG